jgi:ABC-2 type transport system permease protein
MLLTFYRQAYYSYKGLFLWLNLPAFLANMVLRPALSVALFCLAGRFARNDAAAEAYVVGTAAFVVSYVILGSITQGFAYERGFGTLSHLYASTANRFETYISRCIFHFPNAMLTIGSGIAATYLFLGNFFTEANWAAVLLAMAAMAVSIMFFALCFGAMCIVFRDWGGPSMIPQVLFVSLTGAYIPRDELPGFLFAVGSLLPMTHAIEGLRAALNGAGLAPVRDDLLLELAVALAYLAIGYVLFRLVENHARRTGAYETMS